MSMQGNLKDMTIADLIQHNCQDHKTAEILIENEDQEATLFFKNGRVVHASLNGHQGEEVIFQILAWNEGSFILETGIDAPVETITRSWSSLLLEGARRIDEDQLGKTEMMEVSQMAQKLNDILKELGGEVSGYLASAVVGMDGLNIADHSKSGKSNPEAIGAQLAVLFKLVDTSTGKMNAGALEDNLLTTDNAYVLTRYLPGKSYFLGVAVDRKSGNLGNLRLMSKLYTDRIAKAMPR